jgi:hypothetical protein
MRIAVSCAILRARSRGYRSRTIRFQEGKRIKPWQLVEGFDYDIDARETVG